MSRELTGRHVLIGMVGAFGVIIAVNVFMAWNAIHSFPGVETHQPYVDSQRFQHERAAQMDLGWTLQPDYANGELILWIRDAADVPVRARNLRAIVGRPTHRRDDLPVVFQWRGDHYAAPVALAEGHWLIDVTATAANGTAFRQRLHERVRAKD